MTRKMMIAIFCLSCAYAKAGKTELMDDPIFGIRYDISVVHFQSAPPSLSVHCSDLRNRYATAWIYAHATTKDAEYFVISRLVRSHDGTHGREVGALHPDINGLLVAISRGNSRCAVKAQDGFYWTSDEADPLWKVPDSDLAIDALHRYTKAFGSKKKFLDKVRHREHLAPVMLKQLDAFEKQVGR